MRRCELRAPRPAASSTGVEITTKSALWRKTHEPLKNFCDASLFGYQLIPNLAWWTRVKSRHNGFRRVAGADVRPVGGGFRLASGATPFEAPGTRRRRR